LHKAAVNGHPATVSLLLEHGADIEAVNNVCKLNYHGGNSLCSLLVFTLPSFWPPSNSTGYCEYALILPFHQNLLMEVLLLLKFISQLQAKTFSVDLFLMQDGSTALHQAASNGHMATVSLLLEQGANIEAMNKVCNRIHHDGNACYCIYALVSYHRYIQLGVLTILQFLCAKSC
jgi:ankyrin repeat protein